MVRKTNRPENLDNVTTLSADRSIAGVAYKIICHRFYSAINWFVTKNNCYQFARVNVSSVTRRMSQEMDTLAPLSLRLISLFSIFIHDFAV